MNTENRSGGRGTLEKLMEFPLGSRRWHTTKILSLNMTFLGGIHKVLQSIVYQWFDYIRTDVVMARVFANGKISVHLG